VFIEGHSITFELFGVPRHGGRLPFFPTQPGWISGVHQTGVRSKKRAELAPKPPHQKDKNKAQSH
ncbi:hypothetical protein, partial [Rothia nasimurium]|uniref:hypothetical protein n=1 Tax=Rothia nasimurium TaxID=85336 RepID=UPI001F38B202